MQILLEIAELQNYWFSRCSFYLKHISRAQKWILNPEVVLICWVKQVWLLSSSKLKLKILHEKCAVWSTWLHEKGTVWSMWLHEKCTTWRMILVWLKRGSRSRSKWEVGGGIEEGIVMSEWSLTRRQAVSGWGCWRQEQKEQQGSEQEEKDCWGWGAPTIY